MWKKFIEVVFNRIKKNSTKAIEGHNSSVIALVALKKWELPNKEGLRRFFEEKYNIRIVVNNWKEDIGTFDLDDSQAIITLMPNGIEWSELEDSCHRAWYFDKAKEKLKEHKAHLVVSINGGWKEKQLNKSIQLSRIVTGVIEQQNTLGVYWYNSKMIRDSEEFYMKCINMTEEKLPIELWIDIRFRINSSFKEDIYTVGMEKIGFHNVEVINSRLDSYIVYIFIYELCNNIVSSGQEIEEGEILRWDSIKFQATYKTGAFINEVVLNLSMV